MEGTVNNQPMLKDRKDALELLVTLIKIAKTSVEATNILAHGLEGLKDAIDREVILNQPDRKSSLNPKRKGK